MPGRGTEVRRWALHAGLTVGWVVGSSVAVRALVRPCRLDAEEVEEATAVDARDARAECWVACASLAPALVTLALAAGWAGLWAVNKASAGRRRRLSLSDMQDVHVRRVAVEACLTYVAMLAWVVGLAGDRVHRAVVAELGFEALLGVLSVQEAGGNRGRRREGSAAATGAAAARARAAGVGLLALALVLVGGVRKDGAEADVPEVETSMPLYALSAACAWARLQRDADGRGIGSEDSERVQRGEAALRVAGAAVASLPLTVGFGVWRVLLGRGGGGPRERAWPLVCGGGSNLLVPAVACGILVQSGGAVREGMEREEVVSGTSSSGVSRVPSPWRVAVAGAAAMVMAPGRDRPAALGAIGCLVAGVALSRVSVKRRGRGDLNADTLLHTVDTEGGAVMGLLDWAAVQRVVQRVVQHSLADESSRRIFVFLGISVGAMVLEFVGGVLFNSLSLVSDGFHMLFDCSALALGLGASYVSKHFLPDEGHTFGYGRSEVLSGFVNAVTLVLTAVFILFEALERFMRPPNVTGLSTLMVISIVGLAVNLSGLAFFADHDHMDHHHGHGHHDHHHPGQHHRQKSPTEELGSPTTQRRVDYNIRALFVHALADTLGSVGVIASALAIKFWGWTLADPLCSAVVAATVVASILPVIRSTSSCLFQQGALSRKDMHSLWLALERLPSVAHVSDLRVWALAPQGRTVATLHVVLAPGTPVEHVDRMVPAARRLLRDAGVDEVTIEAAWPGLPAEPAPESDDLLVIPLTPPQMIR